MKRRLTAAASALALMAAAVPAMAEEITVMSWGGAYAKSQVEAYYKPFTAETGIEIVSVDADNPATPIKAMVEAGNVTVDVADVEFADAVRRGHTIGLCFGSAGVGKTLSARRYAHYEKAHDLLTYWGPRSDNDAKIYAALNRSRTVLYTPSVLTTPRTLKDELTQAITRTNMCIEQHLVPPGTATPEAWGWRHGRNYVELIIVDEAERLRPAALELLRDRYDRDDIALIRLFTNEGVVGA